MVKSDYELMLNIKEIERLLQFAKMHNRLIHSTTTYRHRFKLKVMEGPIGSSVTVESMDVTGKPFDITDYDSRFFHSFPTGRAESV